MATTHRRQPDQTGNAGENHHSLLFQYHEDCLNSPLNPSPFILPFDDRIHRFSKQAPDAMPGLFTDSLSQHWGLRPLMDFSAAGSKARSAQPVVITCCKPQKQI
ncbi:hypothetical protein [Aliamphritea spongicola]|nr:hypothetical protein [Aliamphritea spongicola]